MKSILLACWRALHEHGDTICQFGSDVHTKLKRINYLSIPLEDGFPLHLYAVWFIFNPIKNAVVGGFAVDQVRLEKDSQARIVEVFFGLLRSLFVTKENNLINTTRNTPLVIAFAVIVVLFLFFGGGAMTGGMMSGGVHGSGWMVERSWMWTPTLLTLGLGVVLGWFIFKKKE